MPHPATCMICSSLPVSRTIVGGQQRGIRTLACSQLRILNFELYTNLRNIPFQYNGHFGSTFTRGKIDWHIRQKHQCWLEPKGSSIDTASSNGDADKTLRSQMLTPSNVEARETQEDAGYMSLLADVVGTLLLGTLLFGVSPAEATDTLKTCTCLLKECRVELARCIADPGCAANVACLQTCNNRPDETECQIKCGDLFENSVVDQFNDCAVSRKGCVPQKRDEGLFPVPPPSALVQNFDTRDFSGTWYITSGLNRTFDTFDCQVHQFSSSPPNSISAKLAWRIGTPDGGFFTRSAVQNFVQDSSQPGVLYNHGNEFLHYQDDWYVLAAKTEKSPDDYIFIYYRGSNDAWDGYGGAVVYTRSSTLPPSIIPELRNAANRVGLDFNKFTQTDNSCGPEPPLLARLEKKVEEEEQFIAEEVKEEEQFILREVKNVVQGLGKALGDFVRGETDLVSKGAAELKRDEELLLKGLGDEEKALLDELKMEAKDIEQLFGKAIPIRKFR